jgi:uncharacterized protein involved in outer membrane biogenesis
MTKLQKILIAAAVVVALPLLALAALPFLLNGNNFRPALQAQMEQRLHRPVTIGSIQVKTFPLALRISDLLIGQPAGVVSKLPFVDAKEVSVAVDLLPLLRREVVINSVELKSPRIELVRDKAGVWNYDTGTPAGGQSASSGSLTLGRLTIEDGQIALDDQKAGTPRDVYEHIDLDLRHLGSDSRGSLTGNVRLDSMAAVLKIQSDFETGPALSAAGQLSLTSDRMKDPLNVTYDLRRANATSPVTIQKLEAKIGSLSASADGSVNTEATPALLQLRVKTASAPIGDLIRVAALYGAQLPAGLSIVGNLQADVQINGTTEKPVLTGKIEATEAQITAKELAEPVRASKLVVDFTPESAATQPFTVETGSTKLTAQATVTGYSGDKPQVSAAIQTSGARVEELLRMANAYGVKPVGLNGTGTISLDMKFSQAGQQTSYSGTGALQNISLTSPDLPKALNIATAAIRFSDDRIVLDNLQAGMSDMHLNGSLSLKDFARPDLQFNLHVDQVNVDELSQMTATAAKTDKSKTDSAKTNKGEAKQQSTGSLERIMAKGAIAIDKVLYDQTSLTNLKATLDLANGVLKLDPVTANLLGGKEAGAITADLREPATSCIVKVQLTSVDSNQLLSATSSVKNVVSGPLSGNFDLRFISKANQNIATTLNGTAKMQMGPGRISGVHILNELASIGRFMGYTNKQEAYTSVNKISGSLDIQNGVATTNDLLVDLGGGNLTGAGTMGLADQTLKLKITATLTKDYLQKNGIGQAGGLLSTVLANQKGDLVVPAIVSGTFAQPKFAPDAEQMAKLKVSGLLGAGSSGVKGLINNLTGKPPDSTATPGNTTPKDALNNLLNQFGNRGKKTN